MRTKEIKIYDIDDIRKDDDLKNRVLKNWLHNQFESNAENEIHASYKGFKESLPEMDYEMKGLRLRTWIINNYICTIEKYKVTYAVRVNGVIRKGIGHNSIQRTSNLAKEISCPFTGACFDHDFLKPILDFVKNPDESTTWQSLQNVDKILQSTIDDCMEYEASEEYILEAIEANNYEFDKEGNLI